MALLRARRQQKYDFADKARWPSSARRGFDLRLTNRVSRAPTPHRERREEELAMAGGESRWAEGRGEGDGGDGQQGDDDAERKIDRWRPGVIGRRRRARTHAHTHTHTYIRHFAHAAVASRLVRARSRLSRGTRVG